jgi:hypothetical protein
VTGSSRTIRLATEIDTALLAVPRRIQHLVLLGTVIVIVLFSLPRVPRQYADLSHLTPRISQPAGYGSDTIADMYGAKVVLNDVADMYAKARLEQTPIEASTWTKEESAPYPPAVRLTQAALFAVGEWTGIGFYGLTVLLAALFLAISAWYFVQTRWYLFPLVYLNFSFFADRFVYVQDGSYVVMLTCVMGALVLTRRRHQAAPLLMALATTMKLLPISYARYIWRPARRSPKGGGGMPRRVAWSYAGILIAGLLLPYFVWDNYLDIYRFANERKGNDSLDIASALLFVVPFTLVLWYVEERRGFDAEDRVGWGLVPFAMLAAMLANSGRHLLIALIVPDQRAGRNLAAAIGLALHSLMPGVVRLGSMTYVITCVLCVVLAYELQKIGWSAVLDDIRHPARTLRLLIAGRA